ncbi:MAG: MFS transporter [Chloroflexota bacterium]|nr:MFS transporter [Chloroflexota bacterium]
MSREFAINLPSRRRLTRPSFSGWRVLLLVWIAVFFTGPGQTYGTSPFVEPMIDELGMSRSLFSTLYSVGTLASAVTLMALGRQIDRRGSRLMLSLATVGLALGTFALSLASGPVLVLAGFALTRACGQGLMGLASRTLIPHWFVRQRGRAFSLLGLASTFSLALVPPVHERLISWLGWRGAWLLDGAFLLVVLAPVFFLLIRDRPEDIGQFPDGERPVGDEAIMAASAESERGLTLRQAFRTYAFWGLVGASVVPSLVVTGLAFNQVAIFTEKGMPTSVAATTFTVESLAALPTTLAIGWLVDRYPVRYVLVAGQVVLGLAMVALLLSEGVALALIYAALRGASGALWMIGADVAWPQYYGRKYLGSIRGFGFGVGVFGSALGPLPFGIAYDTLGGYTPAIAALLLLPAAAAIAVWFAKPPKLPAPEVTSPSDIGGP